MQLLDAVRKNPVAVSPDTTLASCAKTMDDRGVGALVVVDGDRPTGIVTDRDIVVRAVARRYPPDARVDSVMSTDLVTLKVTDEVTAAMQIFDSHPLRRLPLVDDDGELAGMVTADDLLINLCSELGMVVRPITGQVLFSSPEPELPVVS